MRIRCLSGKKVCLQLMAFAFVFSVCSFSIQAGDVPELSARQLQDPGTVAAHVDRLIHERILSEGEMPAETVSDADFLRRVQFDLTGTAPQPHEITLFGLDPDPKKREKLVEQLLDSPEYASNWSAYWRDVIYSRATDQRAQLSLPTFEAWMKEQFDANAGWDEIATALLTATGDVRENGATALMFAHMGEAEEVAAEASRIFLGIQIQCANCHDHPTDSWKREDFHTLAAFFPRMRVRQVQDGERRSFEVASFDFQPRNRNGFQDNPERLVRFLDRNRDGAISKEEAEKAPALNRGFDRLIQYADKNDDGKISAEELKNAPAPQMRDRGTTEHFMADLNDPTSQGTKMEPAFFVSNEAAPSGLKDVERRLEFAKLVTDPSNEWFAKAYVNRIWNEMIGSAFYMPIDDMGPERFAVHEDAMELLAKGFTASGYDMKWLFRTIAITQIYQQKLDADKGYGSFAASAPTRLRSDQIYNSLSSLSGQSSQQALGRGRPGPNGAYGRRGGPQRQFNQLFGYDPSTPQDELTGDIPQALFMMNSNQIEGIAKGTGYTKLARLLRDYPNNKDAVSELYLMVLSREPSEREIEICGKYLRKVGNRTEAFEDLMWSLINSSEFITKR